MYICDSTTVCLLLGEWHQEEGELEGQVEQTVQACKRSTESAAHSGVTAAKELHHRPSEMGSSGLRDTQCPFVGGESLNLEVDLKQKGGP